MNTWKEIIKITVKMNEKENRKIIGNINENPKDAYLKRLIKLTKL